MSEEPNDDESVAASEAVEAAHGSRMLEVKVRFCTNQIAPSGGQIVPKHGWTRGVVRVTPNDVHGIEPGPAVPFNSLMELPGKIEQALIDNGITLHLVGKNAKYVAE